MRWDFRRPRKALRELSGFLLLLLVGGCGGDSSGQKFLDPAEVAAGAKLFERYCTSCHGEQGSGGKMTPPMGEIVLRHGSTQDEIAATLAKGRPLGMPAFGEELDREQLRSLAAYVLSRR